MMDASFFPSRDETGEIDGVVILVNDVTDKAALDATQKELMDYLAALDAHAIVAVTDVHGVITFVNEKFCEISQYSRSELYGKTHRVINSGHHDRDFFEALWITISSGRIWQGEICNRARDGSLYWVYSTIVPFLDEDGIPFKYISIRADITKLKEVEQRASFLAHYDPLTGLPNRRLFQDALQKARISSAKNSQYFALVSLDLDNFKRVNDMFGHSVGDDFLCDMAGRILRSIDGRATAARMGGDEFMLLIDKLGTDIGQATVEAELITQGIQAALSAPYKLGRRTDDEYGIISTSSMGMLLQQGDSLSIGDMLRKVDIALFEAKGNGKNQVVLFDDSQQERVNRRFVVENELRDAIERDEMRLFFQPIVNDQQVVVGMEGLIRWQHPARGLVPPNEFIPIAEQGGLILAIGRWVLDRACEMLVEWKSDHERQRWTLSVNVSARQFNEPNFIEYLRSLLRRFDFPPERLCIELTETALLNSIDGDLQDKIAALKKQGVKLALDDFGTGYSSLSYLKRLPLNKLKIDQSFVRTLLNDRKDQGITAAVLSMATFLDLEVVAEGVETIEQFNYLRSLGCGAFQGYLFGRPAPIDTFLSNQISCA
ncbi:putative bifunctional diguanylate cyclase/phosphodiesterase [Herbaspirillum aquaticum]|uniref:GGDEF domain-containing protein n=2 Tax=Herbaspirillum aquaticum TaxID=568783 RepID=A0A225SUP6_9BURK|nr:GGDEF domain-containing phosphodiesterase [Herbaspirillum aquaticum]OWY34640.1 GGDEF domain-containing protein [Herbaspirillum aquaticum]